MASNIAYGNYPVEVKIGSCVASSSKENKIWSGVAGSYGWEQQSISATGAVINDYSTGIAIPTSVENYSSYFGATVEISIGGKTTYAVINDVFADSTNSRIVDLQPGVCKALDFIAGCLWAS